MGEDEPGLGGSKLAADLVSSVAGVGGAHSKAEIEAAEDDGGVLEAVREDDTDHVTLTEAERKQGSGNLKGLLSNLKQVIFVSLSVKLILSAHSNFKSQRSVRFSYRPIPTNYFKRGSRVLMTLVLLRESASSSLHFETQMSIFL